MPFLSIDTLDDPLLDPYRHLKKTNLTRWSGVFIAEGIRLVERLLASRFETVSILVAETHVRRLPEAIPDSVAVYVAPLPVLEQLVGYQFHNGMLACGRRQAPIALEDWKIPRSGRSLIVGCPHTADPDNLGTIIRLSAGLGADGLLVGSASADPFSRRTLRISMGNAFLFPIRETTTFAEDLHRMRQAGFSLVASLLDPQAVPLAQCRRPERMVLMLGNESDGLPSELANLADQKVMIPMSGQIDSLNVGVAAGIMLHHFTQVAAPDTARQ